MFKSLAIAAFSLSSILVAPLASANWQVNNEQSNVSFVSIKKNSVAEAPAKAAVSMQCCFRCRSLHQTC